MAKFEKVKYISNLAYIFIHGEKIPAFSSPAYVFSPEKYCLLMMSE